MRAINWIFAVFGLSLIILVSQAKATTTVTVDGSWWASNSREARFYVVQGIVEGEMQASIYLSNDICGQYAKSAKTSKEYIPCMRAFNPAFTKKFVVYMNYVSNFYDNYPQATDVRVTAIIWCHQDSQTPNDADECEKKLVSNKLET